MLAPGVEHDLEGADRHDEQDEPDGVDARLDALGLERREQGPDPEGAERDNRQVDEEDPRPAPIVADDAAEDRAEDRRGGRRHRPDRSEEHTSELQSLLRISYAVF